MSGKKHVFKMVPGKVFDEIVVHNVRVEKKTIYDANKIARVEFEPLDSKSTIKPELRARMCTIITYNTGKLLSSCIEDNGKGLVRVEGKDLGNSYSFAYYGDQLMAAYFSMPMTGGSRKSFLTLKPIEYQYVTWEELDNNTHKCYFSDDQGNIIDSGNVQTLENKILLKEQIIINDIISSNKDIILSDAFAKTFITDLTENQLKTLANTLSNEQLQKIIPELNSNQLQVLAQNLTDGQLQKIIPELSSNQLQALAKNLTDEQLQALVDHLTNHQLQTLAQELNPEKLQIIVPILNDAQLEALIRDLNPEQVKEILPHLKVDQFKALIKTLNDEQFTVLAKDLAEHHLTILSKELEGDQLKALVNSLQEDQLKDLVNKLDPEKLEAIAQDLTDSNRIQIIIKSLADNPEKLQAFARNMSNEQFKELLDNVGAEELKDIIHKLPYEKVTAVIGDLGNQDQSKAIIDALKETLEKQSELINGMREELKEFITPPPMDSSHIIEEYYGFGLV